MFLRGTCVSTYLTCNTSLDEGVRVYQINNVFLCPVDCYETFLILMIIK